MKFYKKVALLKDWGDFYREEFARAKSALFSIENLLSQVDKPIDDISPLVENNLDILVEFVGKLEIFWNNLFREEVEAKKFF